VLADTGYQNPGLQGFLAGELPWLAQQRVRTIVSVTASSLGEYGELARRVGNAPGVHGVEVNLDGLVDPHQTGKVLHVVRREVPRGVLVLAKLRTATGLVDLTRSVVREGADAVVVSPGLPGMALDADTLAPLLGDSGRLSGPALLPVTLRAVWDLHAELPEVPLVAGAGVRTAADAVALLAAGATAVQVGSALLADPAAPATVATGIAEDLARRGLRSHAELVGLAHRAAPHDDADQRPYPATVPDPGERP
jgi:dihydroorotate dehydrogenase (NAD+) catalytic subunit